MSSELTRYESAIHTEHISCTAIALVWLNYKVLNNYNTFFNVLLIIKNYCIL